MKLLDIGLPYMLQFDVSQCDTLLKCAVSLCCSGCGLTSIGLGDDVGDVSLRGEGEVEHVGGVVLPGQRVHDLCVNSDLDVLPFRVAHLPHRQ